MFSSMNINLVELANGLSKISESLRSSHLTSYYSLLQLANSKEISVKLELAPKVNALGEFDIVSNTITIKRFSQIRSTKTLHEEDESLLTPTERFSVAHELGHYFAYKTFNIEPIYDATGEYWRQEKIMDKFAENLLVPNHLANKWARDITKTGNIFNKIGAWSEECRISISVIFYSLCRVKADYGFLQVILGERKKDNQEVLKVINSIFGKKIMLPKKRSHIDNKELLEQIKKSKNNEEVFKDFEIGKCKKNDYLIKWFYFGEQNENRLNTTYLLKKEKYPVYWLVLTYFDS